MGRFLLLCFGVVFGFNYSYASTLELQSAVYNLVRIDTDKMTLEKRKETALAMQEYWQHFNNRVPKLSPNEREWIESELDTTEINRINRVTNTEQYALWDIDLHLNQCLTSISNVIEAQNSIYKQEYEMFYWLFVIICYNDIDDLLYYLRKSNLSNGKYDEEFELGLSGLIRVHLINSVIPSAMRDQMNWTFRYDQN